jgi:hypothetical protein
MRPALVALLASCLALAGCSGKDATAGDAGATGDGGSGVPLAVDSVPAPTWQVGQWWEWETTFADGSKADETFCSIVLSTGTEAVLVTEKDGMAKESAAFGHPLLAPVRTSDLAMGGWSDAPFSVLSFPLTDGKAWTSTMPNIAWDVFLPADTVEVAFTATFGDAPVGEAPVVSIVGKVGEAKVMDADYDPATGWFRTLTFYDVDPGQDPLEISWRAKSAGLDYAGPYYQAQATLLLAFDDRVGFSDVPVVSGGQPYTDAPQPYHTFTMGADKVLYGYFGAASVAGARSVVLVDPANQERHLATPGAPEGEQYMFLDEPGQAGEWKLATAGAGGFSGAFAELYEVTEGAFAMEPGQAAPAA